MKMELSTKLGLAIVDQRKEDYAELLEEARHWQIGCRHFSSGEDALRLFYQSRTCAWFVNAVLPDTSGTDLLQLVRERAQNTPVFLISDVYSPHDELAARAVGATAYFCKPASRAWLLPVRSTIRAGPVARTEQSAVLRTQRSPPNSQT